MKMRTILAATTFGLIAITGCDSTNRLPSGLPADLVSNESALRAKALEGVSAEQDATRRAENLFAIAMNLTGAKGITIPEDVRLASLKSLAQLDGSAEHLYLQGMLACLFHCRAEYDDANELQIKGIADDFIKEPALKLIVERYTSRKEKIEDDIRHDTEGAIFLSSVPRYKWEAECPLREVLKAVFSYLHKHDVKKFVELCKLITSEDLMTSDHVYRREIPCENGQKYYELSSGEYAMYKYCLELIWSNTAETREDMKRSGEVAAMFGCDELTLAGARVKVKIPLTSGAAIGVHILEDVAPKDPDKAIRLGMMFSEGVDMDDNDVVVTKVLCQLNEQFAKAYTTRFGNGNDGKTVGKMNKQASIARELGIEQENKRFAEEKARDLQKKMDNSISWEKCCEVIRKLDKENQLVQNRYWDKNRGMKVCWEGKISAISGKGYHAVNMGGKRGGYRKDDSVMLYVDLPKRIVNGVSERTSLKILIDDNEEIEKLYSRKEGDSIVFEGVLEYGCVGVDVFDKGYMSADKDKKPLKFRMELSQGHILK